MKNQECKTRPQVVHVNSNNAMFYPFSIKTSKCSGNGNNINSPYAKICVPDVIKDLNVEVFNLMSRTNETRFIEWNETCKCKCIDNLLIKQYVIKDLFGILVIVRVNVIKQAMLVNI